MMNGSIRIIAGALAVAFFFLANLSTTVESAGGSEIRVLFIGNSLTYWNDLPAIVQAMAKAGKQRKVHVESVVFPDYALEDHWNRGDALKAIKKGRWDIVAFQQGPSASISARANLIQYVARYTTEIRSIGAKPTLFGLARQTSQKRSGRIDPILLPGRTECSNNFDPGGKCLANCMAV